MSFISFISRYKLTLISFSFAGIIMIPLFMSGYLILLDWVPGPVNHLQYNQITHYITIPSQLCVYGLHYIMIALGAPWMTQKIILFFLLFFSLYLPLRFSAIDILIRASSFGGKRVAGFKHNTFFLENARVAGAFFFAMNPFIYERILSGQWLVAVGYVLSWPVFYFFLDSIVEYGSSIKSTLAQGIYTQTKSNNIYKESSDSHFVGISGLKSLVNIDIGDVTKNIPIPQYKNYSQERSLLFASISILIVGAWSIHFLIINVLLFSMLFVYLLILGFVRGGYTAVVSVVKSFFLPGAVLSFVSLYWIAPYIYHHDKTLSEFTGAHMQAFATVTAKYFGSLWPVVTLRGFWPEMHTRGWASGYNASGADNVLLFTIAWIVSFVFIFFGIRLLAKYRKDIVGYIIIVGILSAFFAMGTNTPFFLGVNTFLFDKVWFWRGFRDVQKWAGILAIVYSIGISFGVYFISSKVSQLKIIKGRGEQGIKFVGVFIIAIFLITIMSITPHMLWGFNGQVTPVYYPPDWHQAEKILLERVKENNNGGECKVLFLPWHLYYTASFNNNHIAASPAKSFFHCTVYTGQNIELGKIVDIPKTANEKYATMSRLVTARYSTIQDAQSARRKLNELGIRYVLWANGSKSDDRYKYSFLNTGSGVVRVLYEGSDISLYDIGND